MNKITKYPRNQGRRIVLNLIIRGLFRLLARVKVEGRQNIPKTGPVILAGNHVENLEAGFQIAFPKRIVEPIGAGDIPFGMGLDGLIAFYGFISVDRGTVDRGALREAQSVLEQGAVLGIYPEGGTWRPGKMPAQIGVAMLSERGKAPVVPIGYNGFNGSTKAAITFKRPKLTMRVGKPIPPLVIDPDGPPKKEQMQVYADEVMRQVYALLDEDELNVTPDHESYKLHIKRSLDNQDYESLPPLEGADAFVSFINTVIILDTLRDSLSLPTQCFYSGEDGQTLDNLIQGIDATMNYLKEKPNFFTYRMGQQMGGEVPLALNNLRQLAIETKQLNQTLLLDAEIEAKYRNGEVKHILHQFAFRP
jgi:1-acyl-sn-glycerol-3-phosphate acyltransferase